MSLGSPLKSSLQGHRLPLPLSGIPPRKSSPHFRHENNSKTLAPQRSEHHGRGSV